MDTGVLLATRPNLSVARWARRVTKAARLARFAKPAASAAAGPPRQAGSIRSRQPPRNQPIRPIPSRSSVHRHAANNNQHFRCSPSDVLEQAVHGGQALVARTDVVTSVG